MAQQDGGGSAGRRKSSTKPVGQNAITSVLPPDNIPLLERELSADDETLAALGYIPEFKREFTLWSTFCVSFSVLGLLPSFASTLLYGLGTAGTAGMVWGWIIAAFFILMVAMSMAELASAMPTSGGLYYAAAVLAPKGWGPLAAWLTGWSNFLAQATSAPSVNYAAAAMILAGASIGNPNYVPENWHIFLLTTLIMILHAIISSMPTKMIARFNTVGTLLNLTILLIVIILIPAITNRESQGLPRFSSSADVWGTIYPGTDFPPGIAVLMSFIAPAWTMSGYDSPFHLSEESSNASVAAPRAIVLTAATGGIIGWALQLVVAYTVEDIDAVLESELGQPYAAYLLSVLPASTALAILSLTILCAFFMGQGCMVAASRVTFAYSRDSVLPGSRWTSKVNPYTKTPVNAVFYNCAVGIVLILLVFGGPLTIGAIFSIGAIAAFVSFSIPIFIRLFFVGDRFHRGPWHLGRFSMPIGALACAFVALMVPILCLPTVTGSDLDASGMNWTVLVYGGPMFGAMVWWVVSARKWFRGPKIQIQHTRINGVDAGGSSSSGSEAEKKFAEGT